MGGNRSSIRLPEWDYSSEGWYFVTICSHNRECLFGEIVDKKMILNEFGKVVDAYWKAIPEHYPNVELDVYIVMPNHVHGIIVIQRDENEDKNREKEAINMSSMPFVGACHDNKPNAIEEKRCCNSESFVGAIHELPLRMTDSEAYRRERRQMLLPKIMGRFKMQSAKNINNMREMLGFTVWQRNYYEHIIRDDKDLFRIREYIQNNPQMWEDDEENL